MNPNLNFAGIGMLCFLVLFFPAVGLIESRKEIMRSMCELINLFVDGKITTSKQAWELVMSERAEGESALALAEALLKTATRLLPARQAEAINALFNDEGDGVNI